MSKSERRRRTAKLRSLLGHRGSPEPMAKTVDSLDIPGEPPNGATGALLAVGARGTPTSLYRRLWRRFFAHRGDLPK
jgi:hypothetical protein